MKQTIYIQGITCDSCVEKITEIFYDSYKITDVVINKNTWKVEYEHSVFLTNSDIEKMLDGTKYSISEIIPPLEDSDSPITFFTYTPLFTLFWYILLLSVLGEYIAWSFDIMRFMQHFMAGFFITFSYFKLINLKEFAMSYSMYDIVAKRWKHWWYIYAFIELMLGLLFLIGFVPLFTNITTFIVMSVSIVGVIQSVRNKKQIKCACLWAVFDLPMSTITIIEDALMIAMSGLMIFLLIL